LEKLFKGVKKCARFKDGLFLLVKDVAEVDRAFLVERHLMSREHEAEPAHKGLVISKDESVSVMLNEEDHLRIQGIKSGLDIVDTWKMVDDLDTELSQYLPFAYSSKFGYLTSCPTNTGTGLRASVMLHLPALEMTDQIENVYDAVSKLGLTIRGFYGEGSETTGNFFQISNQVSLGHSETDILDNLERVINKVVAKEEDTRTFLMHNKKSEIADNIFRSYGTLKSARIITSREAIKLLSSVRLGVDLGVVKDVNKSLLNEILLVTQPGHLQKNGGQELTPYERDIKRADMIREKLGEK